MAAWCCTHAPLLRTEVHCWECSTTFTFLSPLWDWAVEDKVYWVWHTWCSSNMLVHVYFRSLPQFGARLNFKLLLISLSLDWVCLSATEHELLVWLLIRYFEWNAHLIPVDSLGFRHSNAKEDRFVVFLCHVLHLWSRSWYLEEISWLFADCKARIDFIAIIFIDQVVTTTLWGIWNSFWSPSFSPRIGNTHVSKESAWVRCSTWWL